jgi:hypothetical protein
MAASRAIAAAGDRREFVYDDPVAELSAQLQAMKGSDVVPGVNLRGSSPASFVAIAEVWKDDRGLGKLLNDVVHLVLFCVDVQNHSELDGLFDQLLELRPRQPQRQVLRPVLIGALAWIVTAAVGSPQKVWQINLASLVAALPFYVLLLPFLPGVVMSDGMKSLAILAGIEALLLAIYAAAMTFWAHRRFKKRMGGDEKLRGGTRGPQEKLSHVNG